MTASVLPIPCTGYGAALNMVTLPVGARPGGKRCGSHGSQRRLRAASQLKIVAMAVSLEVLPMLVTMAWLL
jgi:hypothetical protein